MSGGEERILFPDWQSRLGEARAENGRWEKTHQVDIKNDDAVDPVLDVSCNTRTKFSQRFRVAKSSESRPGSVEPESKDEGRGTTNRELLRRQRC